MCALKPLGVGDLIAPAIGRKERSGEVRIGVGAEHYAFDYARAGSIRSMKVELKQHESIVGGIRGWRGRRRRRLLLEGEQLLDGVESRPQLVNQQAGFEKPPIGENRCFTEIG